MKSTNVTRIEHLVPRSERWARQGHTGGIMWFTGLPASGKSTLVHGLEARLFEAGFEAYAFDSSRISQGLNKDLGYSREDRRENIRRASELAAIMARAGLVVITGFISPYAADRAAARETSRTQFHEIYLDISSTDCEARDTRGRYVAAREDRLKGFTGVNAPYEVPRSPDLTLPTAVMPIAECLDRLVAFATSKFRLDGED